MRNEVKKCPQCGKVSNGNRHESYLICRECGIAYTECGTDRRCDGRLKIEKECTLTYKGRESPVEATVYDVSLNGARTQYVGTPLCKDAMLYLDVDGLDLHTPVKVIWTISVNKDKHSTGLQLVWPFKEVSTVSH
ncbi:MAG: PilZ domain-containing protein [Deltaproteobacteria bacterium]|nr:PilZ domain-containing protein [Deltaproteobacteria bacterium]